MQNKIFVIDLDSTLIREQSQGYLIKYLKEIKKISLFKYLVIMSGFVLYKLSLYKNAGQLLQYSLNNFKNDTEENIYGYVNDFFEKVLKNKYFIYSKEFVKIIQNSGSDVVVLSAVIDPLVKRICEDLNVNKYISTKLQFSNGLFTGKIINKQNYGEHKLENIKKYLYENNLSESDVIIVTDHISDISLIKYFKNSIIANPNSKMKKWARQNNCPIIYLDNNESIQYIKHYIESK